jgi:heptosyltransferase-2
VAIGAGSTNSRAKRWLPERFAELNDRLQRELGANVILLGSAGEEKVANKVMEKSVFKPIRLTGKTTLDEAVSILAEVDLLISNDMGLAHIAPATGTDTIVIFGPTNPDTTRPFSQRAEIIRKDVECSPCMLRDCPIDHRCMTWISTDDVFRAAAKKLSNQVAAKAQSDYR